YGCRRRSQRQSNPRSETRAASASYFGECSRRTLPGRKPRAGLRVDWSTRSRDRTTLRAGEDSLWSVLRRSQAQPEMGRLARRSALRTNGRVTRTQAIAQRSKESISPSTKERRRTGKRRLQQLLFREAHNS